MASNYVLSWNHVGKVEASHSRRRTLTNAWSRSTTFGVDLFRATLTRLANISLSYRPPFEACAGGSVDSDANEKPRRQDTSQQTIGYQLQSAPPPPPATGQYKAPQLRDLLAVSLAVVQRAHSADDVSVDQEQRTTGTTVLCRVTRSGRRLELSAIDVVSVSVGTTRKRQR